MRKYEVWTGRAIPEGQKILLPQCVCPHARCSVLGAQMAADDPSWFLGPGPGGTEATMNCINISGLGGPWKFTPGGLRLTGQGQECGRGERQR